MERKHRVYFTTYAALAAFGILFALAIVWAVPVAWYYPVERKWSFATRPQGLAMDWYGRILLALTGALVASVLTWFSTRALRPPKSQRPFRLLALWTALVFISTALISAYQLAHRHPRAEPLPSEYVPR